MVQYAKGLHKRLIMVEVQGHHGARPSVFCFMIYYNSFSSTYFNNKAIGVPIISKGSKIAGKGDL